MGLVIIGFSASEMCPTISALPPTRRTSKRTSRNFLSKSFASSHDRLCERKSLSTVRRALRLVCKEARTWASEQVGFLSTTPSFSYRKELHNECGDSGDIVQPHQYICRYHKGGKTLTILREIEYCGEAKRCPAYHQTPRSIQVGTSTRNEGTARGHFLQEHK
jgi:hypothetical protein